MTETTSAAALEPAASYRLRTFASLALVGLLVVGLSGCFSVFRVKGSGTPATTSFDLAGFTEVDVGGAFDVDVMVDDGPILIEVTVDDNLTDHLDVHVRGGRLHIGFERGNYTTRTTPTAIVRLPRLTEAVSSGASAVRVTGVTSGQLRVESSGAASLHVTGSASDLFVEASGASTTLVDGDFGQLVADVSGASDLDGRSASTGRAQVDGSGASTIRLGDVETVSGELSGASTLSVPPEAVVDVDRSGGSNVERRSES